MTKTHEAAPGGSGQIEGMEVMTMTKREALLGGPGLRGYAYRAAVYCVDCGQGIIEDLPQDMFADSRGRNTDCVPQPIFFGEHDESQHCAECGVYMYGPRDDDRPELSNH